MQIDKIKRIAGPGSDFLLSFNLDPVVTGSSGTTPQTYSGLHVYLMEYQDDGSVKTFDSSDGTLKAGAVVGEFLPVTHRKASNSVAGGQVNTGTYTVVVPGAGFTDGKRYNYRVSAYDNTAFYTAGDFVLES